MPTIAETLQAAAESRQLTGYRIAKVTGVPQPSVHRILTGETPTPQIGHVALIAQAVGLRVPDWLRASFPLPAAAGKNSGK